MKFSVLINNYNYGRFLDRALASVAAQTRPADEVIVVDDGSTDDSLSVARRWAEKDSRINIIAKDNGGHLSALNAGFRAASGDIITFLDADDEYLPTWLERLASMYAAAPEYDLVYCRVQMHGLSGPDPHRKLPDTDFDFGLTFFRTLLEGAAIGGPTSAISARSAILKRFLPFSHEQAWRMCAERIVVYGTSLHMGRCLQLAERLVRYHCHGRNAALNQPNDAIKRLRLEIASREAISQLLDHGWNSQWQGDLPRLIAHEFQCIPHPRLRDVRTYARMIRRSDGRGRVRRQLQLWVEWWKKGGISRPSACC